MWRIEGDGSFSHTIIWRDDEQIDYNCCEFIVSEEDGCVAVVDDVAGRIDRMVISAVYMIISNGEFSNTKVLFNDEMLRGVQFLAGQIKRDCHPMITIEAIMLPNIVEVKDLSEDSSNV